MRPDICSNQAERARVCLALTCGLPGAGKTSLCKAILAFSESDVLIRHICFDDTVVFDPSNNESTYLTNATTFKVIKLCSFASYCHRMLYDTAMKQWVCRRPAGNKLNSM